MTPYERHEDAALEEIRESLTAATGAKWRKRSLADGHKSVMLLLNEEYVDVHMLYKDDWSRTGGVFLVETCQRDPLRMRQEYERSDSVVEYAAAEAVRIGLVGPSLFNVEVDR